MSQSRPHDRCSRRAFLGASLVASAGALIAACAPPPPPTATPAPAPAPARPAEKPTVAAAPTQPPAKPAEKPTAVPAPTQPPAKPTAAPTAKPAAPAAQSPAAIQPAQIRYVEWGWDPDIKAAQKIFAMFAEKMPQIKVKLEYWPMAQFYEKLKTEIAGGTPPDVSFSHGEQWGFHAARGLLVPLDEMRKRDNFYAPWPEELKTLLDPVTMLRGKVYAVPYFVFSLAYVYLKEPFDKAGIKYPTDDWTVDQWLDICLKLTKPAEKLFGYEQRFGHWAEAGFMRAERGEMEWDSIVEPRKAKWDQPGIIDALQLHSVDIVHKHKITPSPAALSAAGYGAMIGTGKTAMINDGSWVFPVLKGPDAKTPEGREFDVVMPPLPRSGKRPSVASSNGVHPIWAASKARDAAWELVKFMSEEPAQATMPPITGRQPVTIEHNYKYWVPDVEKTYGIKNAKAFVEILKTGATHLVGGPIDPGYLTREGGITEAFDKMQGQGQPAAQVIPEMNKKLQKALDDFWATYKE
ncbi:MAG: sugar ABC transporter substrate-binding protein [Chloroflexi bacterium]|nr:sugar ABC transporter substrate-binding protein [Chloroflexota bacterium]